MRQGVDARSIIKGKDENGGNENIHLPDAP